MPVASVPLILSRYDFLSLYIYFSFNTLSLMYMIDILILYS